SLYEALYGERPFAADTVPEMITRTCEGRVRPPPPSSRVPAWVRRAVVRGLDPDPDRRHPSMDALLAALTRDPAVIARRVAVVVGIVAAFAVALAPSLRRAGAVTPAVCAGSEAQLEGVWDPARKQRIEAAFHATGRAYAGEAFGRVSETLDAYAHEWSRMHRDACEATRARRE